MYCTVRMCITLKLIRVKKTKMINIFSYTTSKTYTMKLIFLICTDEFAGLQYLFFTISSRETLPFNARMDCPLLFVHLLVWLHAWGIPVQKEYIEENPCMKYTKE
jgi:hypothetical protein